MKVKLTTTFTALCGHPGFLGILHFLDQPRTIISKYFIVLSIFFKIKIYFTIDNCFFWFCIN
jgi:hypothetical protein